MRLFRGLVEYELEGIRNKGGVIEVLVRRKRPLQNHAERYEWADIKAYTLLPHNAPTSPCQTTPEHSPASSTAALLSPFTSSSDTPTDPTLPLLEQHLLHCFATAACLLSDPTSGVNCSLTYFPLLRVWSAITATAKALLAALNEHTYNEHTPALTPNRTPSRFSADRRTASPLHAHGPDAYGGVASRNASYNAKSGRPYTTSDNARGLTALYSLRTQAPSHYSRVYAPSRAPCVLPASRDVSAPPASQQPRALTPKHNTYMPMSTNNAHMPAEALETAPTCTRATYTHATHAPSYPHARQDVQVEHVYDGKSSHNGDEANISVGYGDSACTQEHRGEASTNGIVTNNHSSDGDAIGCDGVTGEDGDSGGHRTNSTTHTSVGRNRSGGWSSRNGGPDVGDGGSHRGVYSGGVIASDAARIKRGKTTTGASTVRRSLLSARARPLTATTSQPTTSDPSLVVRVAMLQARVAAAKALARAREEPAVPLKSWRQTHAHAHAHTRDDARTRVLVQPYMHARTRTQSPPGLHTRAHTGTDAYARTQVHAGTQTRIQPQPQIPRQTQAIAAGQVTGTTAAIAADTSLSFISASTLNSSPAHTSHSAYLTYNQHASAVTHAPSSVSHARAVAPHAHAATQTCPPSPSSSASSSPSPSGANSSSSLRSCARPPLATLTPVCVQVEHAPQIITIANTTNITTTSTTSTISRELPTPTAAIKPAEHTTSNNAPATLINDAATSHALRATTATPTGVHTVTSLLLSPASTNTTATLCMDAGATRAAFSSHTRLAWGTMSSIGSTDGREEEGIDSGAPERYGNTDMALLLRHSSSSSSPASSGAQLSSSAYHAGIATSPTHNTHNAHNAHAALTNTSCEPQPARTAPQTMPCALPPSPTLQPLTIAAPPPPIAPPRQPLSPLLSPAHSAHVSPTYTHDSSPLRTPSPRALPHPYHAHTPAHAPGPLPAHTHTRVPVPVSPPHRLPPPASSPSFLPPLPTAPAPRHPPPPVLHLPNPLPNAAQLSPLSSCLSCATAATHGSLARVVDLGQHPLALLFARVAVTPPASATQAETRVASTNMDKGNENGHAPVSPHAPVPVPTPQPSLAPVPIPHPLAAAAQGHTDTRTSASAPQGATSAPSDGLVSVPVTTAAYGAVATGRFASPRPAPPSLPLPPPPIPRRRSSAAAMTGIRADAGASEDVSGSAGKGTGTGTGVAVGAGARAGMGTSAYGTVAMHQQRVPGINVAHPHEAYTTVRSVAADNITVPPNTATRSATTHPNTSANTHDSSDHVTSTNISAPTAATNTRRSASASSPRTQPPPPPLPQRPRNISRARVPQPRGPALPSNASAAMGGYQAKAGDVQSEAVSAPRSVVGDYGRVGSVESKASGDHVIDIPACTARGCRNGNTYKSRYGSGSSNGDAHSGGYRRSYEQGTDAGAGTCVDVDCRGESGSRGYTEGHIGDGGSNSRVDRRKYDIGKRGVDGIARGDDCSGEGSLRRAGEEHKQCDDVADMATSGWEAEEGEESWEREERCGWLCGYRGGEESKDCGVRDDAGGGKDRDNSHEDDDHCDGGYDGYGDYYGEVDMEEKEYDKIEDQQEGRAGVSANGDGEGDDWARTGNWWTPIPQDSRAVSIDGASNASPSNSHINTSTSSHSANTDTYMAVAALGADPLMEEGVGRRMSGGERKNTWVNGAVQVGSGVIGGEVLGAAARILRYSGGHRYTGGSGEANADKDSESYAAGSRSGNGRDRGKGSGVDGGGRDDSGGSRNDTSTQSSHSDESGGSLGSGHTSSHNRKSVPSTNASVDDTPLPPTPCPRSPLQHTPVPRPWAEHSTLQLLPAYRYQYHARVPTTPRTALTEMRGNSTTVRGQSATRTSHAYGTHLHPQNTPPLPTSRTQYTVPPPHSSMPLLRPPAHAASPCLSADIPTLSSVSSGHTSDGGISSANGVSDDDSSVSGGASVAARSVRGARAVARCRAAGDTNTLTDTSKYGSELGTGTNTGANASSSNFGTGSVGSGVKGTGMGTGTGRSTGSLFRATSTRTMSADGRSKRKFVEVEEGEDADEEVEVEEAVWGAVSLDWSNVKAKQDDDESREKRGRDNYKRYVRAVAEASPRATKAICLPSLRQRSTPPLLSTDMYSRLHVHVPVHMPQTEHEQQRQRTRIPLMRDATVIASADTKAAPATTATGKDIGFAVPTRKRGAIVASPFVMAAFLAHLTKSTPMTMTLNNPYRRKYRYSHARHVNTSASKTAANVAIAVRTTHRVQIPKVSPPVVPGARSDCVRGTIDPSDAHGCTEAAIGAAQTLLPPISRLRTRAGKRTTMHILARRVRRVMALQNSARACTPYAGAPMRDVNAYAHSTGAGMGTSTGTSTSMNIVCAESTSSTPTLKPSSVAAPTLSSPLDDSYEFVASGGSPSIQTQPITGSAQASMTLAADTGARSTGNTQHTVFGTRSAKTQSSSDYSSNMSWAKWTFCDTSISDTTSNDSGVRSRMLTQATEHCIQ